MLTVFFKLFNILWSGQAINEDDSFAVELYRINSVLVHIARKIIGGFFLILDNILRTFFDSNYK